MTKNAGSIQTNGRFKPGQSGNPAGKPRGTRHRATQAVLVLLEGEGAALTRKVIEMALAGDITALRLCLERIAPPAKERSIAPDALTFPALRSDNLTEASAAILGAVVAGRLTPSEGHALAGLLEAHRKMVETSELAERVAQLEASQNERKGGSR